MVDRRKGRIAGTGIVTGADTVAPVVSGGARPGAGILSGAGGPPGKANAFGHGRGGKH